MEKFVVASDLHGQAEAFAKVVRHYGDIQYVINGDSIDGPEVKELLNMFSDINSHVNMGNHESVVLGAMTDLSSKNRSGWQEKWLNQDAEYRRTEHGTLDSYGITETNDTEVTAMRLRDAMEKFGHLALLQNMHPYFESNGLLVIHAGLDHSRTWANQKPAINAIAEEMQRSSFTDDHTYLSSFPFANDYKKPYDITTLVTGHSHLEMTSEQRTYSKYRKSPDRVKLGSKLHRGHPLYVYESWTQQVKAFDQN